MKEGKSGCGVAHGTQSCLTLCGLIDYSPSGSSVHGISQASILGCVAISSSGESSQPSDQTRVSCISCIGRPFLFPTEPPGKPSCGIKGFSEAHCKGSHEPMSSTFPAESRDSECPAPASPTPWGSETRMVIVSMCTAARDPHELTGWLEKEEGLTQEQSEVLPASHTGAQDQCC